MENSNVVLMVLDKNYLIPSLFVLDQITCTSFEKYHLELWIEGGPDDKFTKLVSRFLKKLNSPNNSISIEFFSTKGLSGYKYLTSSAWGKFYALSKLRTRELNILYIDSDVMLLPGWDTIWNYTYSKNFGFGAVTYDGHENFVKLFPDENQEYYYFNSGVLLLKSKWWFKQKLDLSWLDLANKSVELGFNRLDQDLFNYLIRGNHTRLPAEFNQNPYKLSQNSKIIHFAGAAKPWGFFWRLLSNMNNIRDHKIAYSIYRKRMTRFYYTFIKKFPILGTINLIIHWNRFTVMNLRNLWRSLNKTLHI